MMAQEDADRVLFRIGRKVAELRKREGLTQEQLAEKLGLSLKYTQRLEAGRENLTIRSLCRIALFFRIEARNLFSRPKNEKISLGRPTRRSVVSRANT